MNRNLLFALILGFFLFIPISGATQEDIVSSHVVCAVGDSHVTPGSFFVTSLRRVLGEDYDIRAEGRSGWTSSRWIRSGDFASVCEGADIVLVSLGGNDRSHGRSWASIKENVDLLIATLPSGTHVFHMTIPRYYRPRVSLTSDGIHLSRAGARRYARIVAPFLRVAD